VPMSSVSPWEQAGVHFAGEEVQRVRPVRSDRIDALQQVALESSVSAVRLRVTEASIQVPVSHPSS